MTFIPPQHAPQGEKEANPNEGSLSHLGYTERHVALQRGAVENYGEFVTLAWDKGVFRIKRSAHHPAGYRSVAKAGLQSATELAEELASQTAPEDLTESQRNLLSLNTLAMDALRLFNQALAAASQEDLAATRLGRRYVLLSPESSQPILALGTKTAPKPAPSAPPSDTELAAVARANGMPENEIRRRFPNAKGLVNLKQPRPEKKRLPEGVRLSLDMLGLHKL